MARPEDYPLRLVVIGASMGGVRALRTLVSGLPPDFPAAVLVVLHVGSQPNLLPSLLSASGPLPAAHATDGQTLKGGCVLVAPPDRHLIVVTSGLRLTKGPKEHHARPAIDPLFRSAAIAFGPAVIGVVLTGRLDDGTAGAQAVKAFGGQVIVQEPEDAVEPSMPASVLRHVDVDHCVALASMAGLLTRMVGCGVESTPHGGLETVVREHALSLSDGDFMEHLESIASPAPFVCPDCRTLANSRHPAAALSLPHGTCVHAAHASARAT